MRHVIEWLLRLTLAGVFLYAGAIKAWDPASFAREIDAYRLLPYAISVAVALLLPWLEIVLAVALVLGVARRGAVTMLAAMLVAFILALISAWSRGLDITCGCFGSADGGGYVWWIGRDVLLLAAVAWLAMAGRWRAFAAAGERVSTSSLL